MWNKRKPNDWWVYETRHHKIDSKPHHTRPNEPISRITNHTLSFYAIVLWYVVVFHALDYQDSFYKSVNYVLLWMKVVPTMWYAFLYSKRHTICSKRHTPMVMWPCGYAYAYRIVHTICYNMWYTTNHDSATYHYLFLHVNPSSPGTAYQHLYSITIITALNLYTASETSPLYQLLLL